MRDSPERRPGRVEPAEAHVRFEPTVPQRGVFDTVAESVPAFDLPLGAMLDLRTISRRGEAFGSFRSALGEESGARSFTALRVWDGPSGLSQAGNPGKA